MQGVIQQVHSSYQKVSEICTSAREFLPILKEKYLKLKENVPQDQIYKYNQTWKNSIQKAVFMITFITWLESGKLISLQEIQNILLGDNGVNLEIENYLIGITYLPSELCRLCINSVVAGDYKLPKTIGQFVKDLYNGFQLLNLKNDFLRKRFDSIKYDLKKIEEINFEIALRGLNTDK